jgi:hypothetical protein
MIRGKEGNQDYIFRNNQNQNVEKLGQGLKQSK